jgi:hypothetical protein
MKFLRSFFLLSVFGFFPGVAAASDTGPGYSYWSAFRPGTTLTYSWRTTGSGQARNMILTVRLKSVDPDRVVLGYRETPQDGPDAFLPGKEALIEFKASEFSWTKEDLFHGVLGTSVAREATEPSVRVERDADTFVVKGEPVPTDRLENEYRIVYRLLAVKNNVTIWRSDEVPGKLVKIIREIRVYSAWLREEVALIDYAVRPASAEEVARLRAERRPVWREVSAAKAVLGETRYFDDLADLRKFSVEWDQAMAEMVPLMPHTDMSRFTRFYGALRRKTGQWREHWSQDRPSLEALLDEAGKDALRPLLEAMSGCLSTYDPRIEWMDRVLFLLDQPIGLQHLRPLQKELPGFRTSAGTMIVPLLEKLKNLQYVNISLLR